jgi:hypothetical protein
MNKQVTEVQSLGFFWHLLTSERVLKERKRMKTKSTKSTKSRGPKVTLVLSTKEAEYLHGLFDKIESLRIEVLTLRAQGLTVSNKLLKATNKVW